MDIKHLTSEQLERLAIRRVKAKMGWYFHAFIYVVINIFLAALSFWQGRHWHIFPLLGWGLGLAIHGAAIWFKSSTMGFEWHQRMMTKERAALLARNND